MTSSSEVPNQSPFIVRWPATADGERFVGRQWVLMRIDRWLAAEQTGLFLLTGEPGAGKSRLAQRVVEVSEGVVSADGLVAVGPGMLAAVHACRADDDRTRAPLRVIESLSNQLAARFPAFQASMTQSVDSVQIRIEHIEQHIGKITGGGLVAAVLVHIDGTVPVRAAFDQLLRHPLEALAATKLSRPVVILIDGLDEALGYPDSDGLVALLGDAGLPEQVRLLLTSRPDPRVLEVLGPPSLDLIADQPDDVDDVHAYAIARLTDFKLPPSLEADRTRPLAGRVTTAANGNFLYARHVLDELLDDPDRISRDPLTLDLPEGLTGIYGAFLERELSRRGAPIREQRWQNLYRPLLGLLAVSQGDGLTGEQLSDITGLRRSEVDDALRVTRQYLSGGNTNEPIRIWHQSFRDYLLAPGPHCVYGDEATAVLAEGLIRRVPRRHGRAELDWLAADVYTRTHLASHAAGAGRLDELVQDPGFLVASDPDRLLPVLAVVTSPAALRAVEVYRHAGPQLRGRPAGEAAAYLQLHARQLGHDPMADQVAASVDLPWSVPWMHWAPVHSRQTLGHHKNGVKAVALRQVDGRMVAVTGGWDRAVRVWDLAEGRLLGELGGLRGPVRALAVEELGDHPVVVAGSSDGTVYVWDLREGTLLNELHGHEGDVCAVAVGQIHGYTIDTIAVTGGDDETVRVWDPHQGRLLAELHGHKRGVSAIALGQLHGRPVAVASDQGPMANGKVRLWDLDQGTLWGEPWIAHDTAVTAIALEQVHGRPVAVIAGRDQLVATITVWDFIEGGPPRKLRGPTGTSILAVALWQIGGRPVLVTGGTDATVRLWDLTEGRLLAILHGHDGLVSAVATGEVDGRAVAVSGGSDGTVRLWDLTKEPSADRLEDSDEFEINKVALGQVDGRPVAVSGGADAMVRLWDLIDGRPLRKLRGYNRVLALAVGEINGRPIAVTGHYGGIQVWDLARGRLLGWILREKYGEARSIALEHADGRPIAVTCFDSEISQVWALRRRIAPWHRRAGRRLGKLHHGHEIWASAAIQIDGRPVAVTGGGISGPTQVWDLWARTMLHVLRDPSQPDEAEGDHRTISQMLNEIVQAVAVGQLYGHPVALTGHRDGVVRLWDLREGTLLGKLRGHSQPVAAVALGELDGHPVAVSGGNEGRVVVWPLPVGEALMVVEVNASIRGISMASRAKRLVVATGRGLLALTLPNPSMPGPTAA